MQPRKATAGSSGRNTPETPPLMAIKLPETMRSSSAYSLVRRFASSPVCLSARCHIRSFPLTESYEAVISARASLLPFLLYLRVSVQPVQTPPTTLARLYTGSLVSCPTVETLSATKLKLRCW